VDHADHVSLLRPAIPKASVGAVWADVGAGSGAFTLALADLLGPGAQIIAVDRDRAALEANAREVSSSFAETHLTTLVADFRADLSDLPQLDGLVAANSLHFVPRSEQVGVIASLAARLQPGGIFVVVEYDADTGNHWVPNPFSARAWPRLTEQAGLVDAQVLHRVPSRFLNAIYSASAQRSRD
jgi:SAM-dependent methyltransferase